MYQGQRLVRMTVHAGVFQNSIDLGRNILLSSKCVRVADGRVLAEWPNELTACKTRQHPMRSYFLFQGMNFPEGAG